MNIIDLKRFLVEVQEMRELQVTYFRTRDKGVLIASKTKEKIVDGRAGEALAFVTNLANVMAGVEGHGPEQK